MIWNNSHFSKRAYQHFTKYKYLITNYVSIIELRPIDLLKNLTYTYLLINYVIYKPQNILYRYISWIVFLQYFTILILSVWIRLIESFINIITKETHPQTLNFSNDFPTVLVLSRAVRGPTFNKRDRTDNL